MLVDLALRLQSPAGRRQRLSILIFHRVLSQPDTLHDDLPDVQRFDEIVGWVSRWFQVLPLDQAMRLMGEGRLPARAAAITFDDGYADNLTEAVPVLRRHGVTGTFFIAASFLDGGRMWNDTVAEALRRCRADHLDLRDLGLEDHALHDWPARRLALARVLNHAKYLPQPDRQRLVDEIAQRVGEPLPDNLMMSTAQLEALRDAGMQVGGHTLTHPILARIDDRQAREEIAGGKARLEEILGQPLELFAYPNGVPGRDYGRKHVDIIRQAGFRAAFTTAAGAARLGSDPFQMPRFTPWDRNRMRFGVRMVRNLSMPATLAP